MPTRKKVRTFPSVRVTAELEVNRHVDEKKKRNCSHGLSRVGMNGKNYLQRDSSNATRTALFQSGSGRLHQEESAEVGNE